LQSEDADEDDRGSEVEELRRQEERLQRALQEMGKLGLAEKKKVSWTEPEASVKRLKGGGYAPAHNVQAVTDLGSGAIIHIEVVDRNNDKRLLLPELEAARQHLLAVRGRLRKQEKKAVSRRVKSVTADGGYHDTLQLAELEKSLDTYVPNQEQSNRRPPGVSEEYLSEEFVYDSKSDEMICPQGERLRRRKTNNGGTAMTYEGKKSACDKCAAKSECCPKSKSGRNVNRPLYEEVLEQVARRLASPPGEWHRRARKVTMEGAFARLTELLNWRRCRCWGKAGATAEALWRMIAHNLSLLIQHWRPLVHQTAPSG